MKRISALFPLLLLVTIGSLPARAQGDGPLPPITATNAAQVRQVARLGNGTYYKTAWSSDGKTIAVGGSAGVWLYDAANMDEAPRLLEGYADSVIRGTLDNTNVTSVVFSADGTLVAAGSYDRTARVWDVKTGQALAVFRATGGVDSVALSSDGMLLASGDESGMVQLWNVKTGQVTASWSANLADRGRGPLTGMAFSPDGSLLVTADTNDVVQLWNIKSGQPTPLMNGGYGAPTSVAFSPDGSQVASANGYAGSVQLWDVKSGQLTTTLMRDLDINSLAFSPDGSILAASDGTSIRLVDVKSGQITATLKGHPDEVSSVAFSP
ncbi:MAG TPA: WD40 repeat domain-containing protein, partial [Aggregatilineales bacterium]|nr:WD40 repeat domain-containing protein [Aggregatilineales bacterium]